MRNELAQRNLCFAQLDSTENTNLYYFLCSSRLLISNTSYAGSGLNLRITQFFGAILSHIRRRHRIHFNPKRLRVANCATDEVGLETDHYIKLNRRPLQNRYLERRTPIYIINQ